MIESTEATSAGSAAGVAGAEAGIGFDAGDGVGIGFFFSCAVAKLAAQKIMHRIIGKVIAIGLSLMHISSNEFCLQAAIKTRGSHLRQLSRDIGNAYRCTSAKY
jgi:hypothetical protein